MLTTCGRTFVDPYLVRAINLAGHADRGHLPSTGGILDQSAWFVALWSAMANENAIILEERMTKK